MEKAVPNGEGAMAAIIGLEESKLVAICKEDMGIVEPANFNTKEQIVISGETEAVKRVCKEAETAGAKRAILLPVSGPFHSILMKTIVEDFEKELNKHVFSDAQIPVINNVEAEPEKQADKIKKLLLRQIYSPVLWRQSVEKMVELGATKFEEVGPGNVLAGLVRRIVKI
jgi:[acyl-carrier-protein] S-malonyltransferase